ncbi:hypothetical protein GCM10027043_27980 [Ferruginibacter profundus]
MVKVQNENILSDRKFRKHIEHYDSRIEQYNAASTCPVPSIDPSLDMAVFPEPALLSNLLNNFDSGYYPNR